MAGTHDNENEKFPFQTLGAATARLLSDDVSKNRQVEDQPGHERDIAERHRATSERAKEQSETAEDDGAGHRGDERDHAEHSAYVEQRLRELSAFERRANGELPARRRRR